MTSQVSPGIAPKPKRRLSVVPSELASLASESTTWVVPPPLSHSTVPVAPVRNPVPVTTSSLPPLPTCNGAPDVTVGGAVTTSGAPVVELQLIGDGRAARRDRAAD